MIAETKAASGRKSRSTVSVVGGRGRGASEDIIDRALASFAAGGFHGVSIGDLARDLGLAKATVLHHFATKEKLYDAVLARVGMSLAQLLDTFGAGLDAGPSGIAAIARAYFDWVRAYPDGANLLSRELLDNGERVSQAQRLHLRPFTERISEHIRKGQALGLIRQCDPSLAVEMILGFCQLHIAAGPTRPHLLGGREEARYTATLDADWPAVMAAAFAAPAATGAARRKRGAGKR